MSPDTVAAILLIAVPIAFNVAFFELGRAFDYPDILRKEPDEILRRFAAGGSGLILRWEALLVSALAMLPLVALLAVVLGASPALSVLSVVVGRRGGAGPGARPRALAVRRPRARPPLRCGAGRTGGDATRQIGRGRLRDAPSPARRGHRRASRLPVHWTVDAGWSPARSSSTAVLPAWLGLVGLPIGVALLIGTLEFVGPNERDGWALAGTIVPDRLHRLVGVADRARRVPR